MEAIALSAQLHRARNRYSWLFSEEGETEVPELPRPKRVSPLARMLALAHRYQRMVDSGEVHDQAELARRLKLSRNRVSQILSLTLLGPEIQEELLTGELGHLSTRELLGVAKEMSWGRQRGIVRI